MATDSHFYGEAEKQMNDLRKYRSELSELKSELATLQKKEKRYKATVKKRQLQSQQTIVESLQDVTAQSSSPLVESADSEIVSSAEPSF